MNRFSGHRPLLAGTVALLVMLPSLAWAYLDPGTGSFLLQIVAGAVLGGIVALGVFWKKTVAFFRRLFSRGARDDRPGPG